MSGAAIALLIGVGAGVIALWVDTRFPQLAPEQVGRVLFHVLASLLIGSLIVAPLMAPLLEMGSELATLIAVFGIAFPAIAYALLTGIWVIKQAQGALGGSIR